MPPGQLPASATPEKFLRSAYDLEKTGMTNEAITAYKSALTRWSDDIPTLFALGNAYYNSHQISSAERVYREILLIDFKNPFALNNLADILCRTGRSNEALKLLEQIETEDIQMQAIIKATREEIDKGCAPFQ